MNIIIGDTISTNRHAINTPPKPSALCFMKYSIFTWKILSLKCLERATTVILRSLGLRPPFLPSLIAL